MSKEYGSFSQHESEVETELLAPTGVRYRFPAREPGRWAAVGWVLTVFGCAVLGGAAFGVYRGARKVIDGGLDLFDVAPIFFTVPFFLVGGLLFGLGHLIRRARSEVVLDRNRVQSIERAGLIRWTWRRPRREIKRLIVYRANLGSPGESKYGETRQADNAMIQAETDPPSRFAMAVGYPYAMCEEVAQALAERLDVPVEASGETFEFQSAKERRPEPLAETPQPADSKVTVEAFDDGVTFTVPPAGLKGSKGLFGFAVMWLGFISLFTGAFVWGFMSDMEVDGEFWVFPAVMSLFWVIGIGIMAAALNMARRRAVLAVVDDSLMILQTGLFGSKRHEWRALQIESIRCGPSGMTVNNVPVMELQVRPHEGRKFGVLSGRANNELRWLAAELTKALKLDQQEQADTPARAG